MCEQGDNSQHMFTIAGKKLFSQLKMNVKDRNCTNKRRRKNQMMMMKNLRIDHRCGKFSGFSSITNLMSNVVRKQLIKHVDAYDE
jgi:hypothetical protein